jgi:quercetin dioxygenase-like cupin family protein
MTDDPNTPSPSPPLIPPDDPARTLVVARSNEDDGLDHVAVAGDTYTILLTGEDTAGRFTLIDMHIPPGGGPPPHRHDFEETFSVLEGEIEVTFRGVTSILRAGETANVPANAPHAFRNSAPRAARLLCTCAPPGQERFFIAIGDPVSGRTSPPPELDDTARAARRAKAEKLAPQFRTELL